MNRLTVFLDTLTRSFFKPHLSALELAMERWLYSAANLPKLPCNGFWSGFDFDNHLPLPNSHAHCKMAYNMGLDCQILDSNLPSFAIIVQWDPDVSPKIPAAIYIQHIEAIIVYVNLQIQKLEREIEAHHLFEIMYFGFAGPSLDDLTNTRRCMQSLLPILMEAKESVEERLQTIPVQNRHQGDRVYLRIEAEYFVHYLESLRA